LTVEPPGYSAYVTTLAERWAGAYPSTMKKNTLYFDHKQEILQN